MTTHAQDGWGAPQHVVTSLLVDRKTAARLLSVSLRTLDNLIVSKELDGVRRIGRRVLISRSSLEIFARRDHRTRRQGQEAARPKEKSRSKGRTFPIAKVEADDPSICQSTRSREGDDQ